MTGFLYNMTKPGLRRSLAIDSINNPLALSFIFQLIHNFFYKAHCLLPIIPHIVVAESSS